jgi:hypothetical protein
MHGPAKGEANSPGGGDPNDRDRSGAQTPEGLPRPVALRCVSGGVRARAERDSGAPVDLVSDRRVCKARERRSGGIRIKAFVGKP